MSNLKNRKQSESTLTTPSDRNKNHKFTLDPNISPLNNEELKEAIQDLNIDSYAKNYPQIERRFFDPLISDQKIGLISFVPAKGAKPNENGIYGFAKLRGNYPNIEDANQRAEDIIKNVDSYHQIYHSFVGRPFPLTNSSDFSNEIVKIDMKKEIQETMSHDMKLKREQEQKEIQDIEQREKQLLEDTKRGEEPTDDHYTTLRVKKAQLLWTYIDTEKKMKQMCGLIAKSRKEIEDLDEKFPQLKEIYFQKYMEARKKAGINTDLTMKDDTFIKYLVEDVKIKNIDDEYNRIYNSNTE